MKKKLSTLLAFVLVIALSVAGTYAYLTDEETVTNTFTVGNVAITLDEADVKTDGTYETDVNNRVTENKYHLLPGHEYIKDPTVHVGDESEDCYLFVTVDNGIEGIEAEGATTIADQMKANGWVAVTGVKNTFVYGAPDAVSAGDDVEVFEKIVIDDDVENEKLATYKDKTVTVTAYAVQVDSFEESTAADIWGAAFAG